MHFNESIGFSVLKVTHSVCTVWKRQAKLTKQQSDKRVLSLETWPEKAVDGDAVRRTAGLTPTFPGVQGPKEASP